MIEIKDLTKSFDGVEVLSHISMTLEKGKIYGLVGRNGSGKTMLMKHILGFVSPTSGSITIDGKILGKDIDAPDNIGAIIENPGFLPGYSGFRNLKMLASIRHKISDEEIKNAIEKTFLKHGVSYLIKVDKVRNRKKGLFESQKKFSFYINRYQEDEAKAAMEDTNLKDEDVVYLA